MRIVLSVVIAAAALQGQISSGEIVKRAAPAVVAIRTSSPSGESSASGFIVDPSGTIVTNLHVVEGVTAVAVKLPNGDVYDQVKVRAFDARKDLAILQVPGFGLPTIPLGDSESVQPGQPVVLIGNPLGVLEGSVSSGVISGVRQLEGFRAIQTDAAANPGNSGGPLLDSGGNAIGVLSFTVRGAESLNFVVPINYARGLLVSKEAFEIDELDKRVSGSRGADLFGQKSGFPQRWKSLVSGASEIVRVDGDRIYVETVLSSKDKDAGKFGVAELTKKGEKFAGVFREGIPCTWEGWSSGQNFCRLERPIEIDLLTPTRIEGSVLDYPQGTKFDCRRCQYSNKGVMRDFVWIPE
jgi:S1-C subfamily serine protease